MGQRCVLVGQRRLPHRTSSLRLLHQPAEAPIASADSPANGSWPFGVITRYECYSPGYTVEQRRDIARKQAEAGSQKAVEHELWSGQIAQASNRLDVPFLMDGKAVNVGAGVVKLALAVAKLEQALADCGLGTQGVIHLTRQAAVVAASQNVIERDGDKLFTALGTPVVAGVGYDPSARPLPLRRTAPFRRRPHWVRDRTTSGGSPPVPSTSSSAESRSSAST